MEATNIFLIFGMVFLTSTGLIAFYWATKTGQLRSFNKGASVIFDTEEPIGKTTDAFPTNAEVSKKNSCNP